MGIRATALKVLPQCNFCDEVAHYDFCTRAGKWAYGCENHWREFRKRSGLGLGEGQLLLSHTEVRRMYNSFTNEVKPYEEAFDQVRSCEGEDVEDSIKEKAIG